MDVQRIILGQMISQNAFPVARGATAEILASGTCESHTEVDLFSEANGAFDAL